MDTDGYNFLDKTDADCYLDSTFAHRAYDYDGLTLTQIKFSRHFGAKITPHGSFQRMTFPDGSTFTFSRRAK